MNYLCVFHCIRIGKSTESVFFFIVFTAKLSWFMISCNFYKSSIDSQLITALVTSIQLRCYFFVIILFLLTFLAIFEVFFNLIHTKYCFVYIYSY